MKNGIFVVIEGIDGSGKGTQVKLLCEWLKKTGHDVFLTEEPTISKIGEVLREGLKRGVLEPETEALLFAADRREHTTQIISEVKKGRIVVCDRYFYSSLAYQGAHGLDIDWLKTVNNFALEPDVLIILDITPEEAMKRVNSRGEKTDYFEKQGFLRKVREIYLNQPTGIVIDSSKSVEVVHEDIKRVLSRFL